MEIITTTQTEAGIIPTKRSTVCEHKLANGETALYASYIVSDKYCILCHCYFPSSTSQSKETKNECSTTTEATNSGGSEPTS